MCKAKLLLCGVAALVLVAGGLMYRTLAVAAQRERAEEALRALRAFEEPRAEAERLLGQEADKVRQGLCPNQEKALDRLAALRAKARERFNTERQELMERMKKLEAMERETLAKIQAEANELQRQLKNRPAGQPAPAADKLDQILERLDRIEQRLERLERANRK